MTLQEAIYYRHSKRIYTTTPLCHEHLDKLNHMISTINEKNGLSIQLITNAAATFSRFKNTYGMFENVSNYFAMVGNKNDPDLKEKQ